MVVCSQEEEGEVFHESKDGERELYNERGNEVPFVLQSSDLVGGGVRRMGRKRAKRSLNRRNIWLELPSPTASFLPRCECETVAVVIGRCFLLPSSPPPLFAGAGMGFDSQEACRGAETKEPTCVARVGRILSVLVNQRCLRDRAWEKREGEG